MSMQSTQIVAVDFDEIIQEYTSIAPDITKLKGEKKLIINKIHYDHLKVHTSETKYSNPSTIEIPNECVLFETIVQPKVGSVSLAFNVNRKSSTRAVIDVKSGLLIGEKLKVPFKVPQAITDQLRGHGGFTKQIVLDKTCRTEETAKLSWDMSATVTAPEGIPLKFKVHLKEHEYDADFETMTYVSGKIRVDYVSDKGRPTWLQPTSISEIIHYLKENPKLVKETTTNMLEHVNVEGQNVVSIMKGHCHFKYGVQTFVETEKYGCDRKVSKK